ncbi:MAG: hypothetical protein AAFU77_17160 [Myxococcota bacterium]
MSIRLLGCLCVALLVACGDVSTVSYEETDFDESAQTQENRPNPTASDPTPENETGEPEADNGPSPAGPETSAASDPVEGDSADDGASDEADPMKRRRRGRRSEPMGFNGFYAGNSFFTPVGDEFDRIACRTGECFDGHVYNSFFRGGANGTPRALWEDWNPRDGGPDGCIENPNVRCQSSRGHVLRGLKVHTPDVFALTVPIPSSSDSDVIAEELGDTTYYREWFEAALDENPDVVFFVGGSWIPREISDPIASIPFIGPILLDEFQRDYETNFARTIEVLRQDYPIYYIQYGKVVDKMDKRRKRYDYLPDRIGKERGCFSVNPNKPPNACGCVFSDSFGHACLMPTTTMALVWIKMLYEVSDDQLTEIAMDHVDPLYDVDDVLDLVDEVVAETSGFFDYR